MLKHNSILDEITSNRANHMEYENITHIVWFLGKVKSNRIPGEPNFRISALSMSTLKKITHQHICV